VSTVLRRGELKGVASEERDVPPAAFTERRNPDGRDTQLSVEIVAKPPVPAHPSKILVGGRDDPRGEANRPGPTQPPERACLEHASEHRLRGRRHLGDLVEEQGAVARTFEETRAGHGCTRERTTLMPVEIGVEHLGRRGSTVDGQERVRVPRRSLVSRPREALLSGPGLAEEQHRRGGSGDPIDDGHHPHERGAGADDRVHSTMLVLE
jgi:hypothetical protein